ncbi:sine oculis-binding protein homolog A-like isoform X1 [Argonauta hians]
MEDEEDASSASQSMVSLIPPFTIKIKSEPLDDDIKNEADMDEQEDRMSTELLEPPYHRPSSSSTSTQLSQLRDSPHSEERNTTITDYAETTMNELLGMYGYDKVSHQETQNLNLERYTASSTPDTSVQGMDDCHGDSDDDDDSSDTPSIGTGPDKKTYNNNSSSNNNNNEKLPSGYIICAWCQKPGLKLFTLKTLNGSKVFCSEVCFTQCRRASFKKNKICDWCKHVRHTVNYVDFQDGEQQLQFCSEKCLNQYKMNIFCQETQEHLQQIQSSLDTTNSSSNGDPDDKQILITPDLWMQEDLARRHKKLRGSDDARNGTSQHHHQHHQHHQQQHHHSHSHSTTTTTTTTTSNSTHGGGNGGSGSSSSKGKESTTEKHRIVSGHAEATEGSGSPHDKYASDKFNGDKSLKERLAKRIHKETPSHTTSPAPTPSLSKRPPQQQPPPHPPPPPPLLPPMFPNPAAMSSWWHQAQMMASMGHGYPAFGGFPPMVYPGMFNPPFTPMMHPPAGPAPPVPESSRPHSRHLSNASSTPGPSVTPTATSSPDLQRHSQSPSVAAPNKSSTTIPRTHHHFPPHPHPHPMWHPGYPMMPFPPHMTPQQPPPPPPPGDASTGSNAPPPPHPPPPHPSLPAFPMPAPNWTSLGMPPQTVIIPFPFLIPLPFPVPIPIPVPMKAEQIEKLLKQTSVSSSSSTTTTITTTTTNTTTTMAMANNNSNSNNNHYHHPHHHNRKEEDETSSECEDIKPRNLTDHLNLTTTTATNNNNNHHHHHQHHHQVTPYVNGNRSSSNSSSSSSSNSSNSMEMVAAHMMRNRFATSVGKNVPKECVTCASFQTPPPTKASLLLPRPSSVLSIKSDSHLLMMQSEMTHVKRPPTPASVGCLDSPKKSRHDYTTMAAMMATTTTMNNDEVIDLSKDGAHRDGSSLRVNHSPHNFSGGGNSSRSHKSASSSSSFSSSSSNAAAACTTPTPTTSVRSLSVPPLSSVSDNAHPHSSSSSSQFSLHVPKIHIVSTPKDPPLSQQLPLPPTDHAYSLRRGLILDAPSVPKRPKSPSPERRNYIRSMPRDIMEARRCLRTRIKTK